jgi:hypothetical protein
MISTSAQKNPAGLSLNKFARGKALDQIQQTGRRLPCTVVKVMGSIVQVAFQVTAAPGQTAVTIPNVTIPIIGAEYVRLPVQIGCKGFATAADAYLGGMTGQGGGVATLSPIGNLTALAFVPLGNVSFFAVDASTLVLYGEPAAQMRDKTGASLVTTTTSGITLSSGGHTLSISSAGIVLDGIPWGTHYHPGVQTGTGNTGAPL